MIKALGSILAGLLVLQGALPSLGLGVPWANVAGLAVTVAVAALTAYLKPAAPPSTVLATAEELRARVEAASKPPAPPAT